MRDEFLRFLEGVEIEECDFDVGILATEGVLQVVAMSRKARFEVAAFLQQFGGVGEVAGLNGRLNLCEELGGLFGDFCQVFGVFCGKGREIVVNVLLDGFEHTLETIENLRDAVGTEVEPRVFLDRHERINLAHTDDFLTAIAFPHLFGVFEFALSVVDDADIVGAQALRDLREDIARIVEKMAFGFDDVAIEEFPRFLLIARGHHFAEYGVDIFAFGLLLLKLAVVVDEDEDDDGDDAEHGEESAKTID